MGTDGMGRDGRNSTIYCSQTHVPVPVRGTNCGLLASLLFTVMVPFLAPFWVGVNVT